MSVLAHHPVVSSSVMEFLPLMICVGMYVVYLAAAYYQNQQGHPWSLKRTASFTLGILTLSVGLSSSLVSLATYDLRGHMAQHLLIGMFAPLGLVAGAPVTLALRTMRPYVARRVTGILRSKPVHWLTHPATALVLNAGGMYVLYLTPLYVISENNPIIHIAVHVHFLAAGCLFAWVIIRPDPAPGKPRLSVRLLVLFLSIAAHTTLSKVMYAYLLPRGTDYTTDQIQAAAQMMYYGGDVAELLLLIVVFGMWYLRDNARTQVREKRS